MANAVATVVVPLERCQKLAIGRAHPSGVWRVVTPRVPLELLVQASARVPNSTDVALLNRLRRLREVAAWAPSPTWAMLRAAVALDSWPELEAQAWGFSPTSAQQRAQASMLRRAAVATALSSKVPRM